MNFSRLLVPTDFGDAADRAVEIAAVFARRIESRVVLAHAFQFPITLFLTDPYGLVVPPFDEMLRSSHQAFDAASARAKKLIPGVETVWVEGDPRERIVELARSRDVDAIVMGTHGRGAIGHAVFGSVAERLVRTSPVPVLTTSAGARRLSQSEGFHHILVPTDFGEPAARALDVAADLARGFSSRLSILHAGDGPGAGGDAEFHAQDPLAADARRALAEAAASVEGRTNRVGVFLLRGDPRACIERFAADETVDLIVMGTHRRRGLSRLTLGSVAERTVRSCVAPVLTLGAAET